MKDQMNSRVVSPLVRTYLMAGMGVALLACPLRAAPFAVGEVKGSFDSTLSFGGLYRLSDPSPDYYGTPSSFNGVPGRQLGPNYDNGNLNYGKGWVSALTKGSHELELKYGNYGALVRGYWFFDSLSDDTLRTKLTDQAKARVVSGAEWLDMYARAKFTLGSGAPVEIRVGRQVLSLGESTFIPNGNNVVNAVDLSKLRVPGAELKEAFLPVNMVKASIGLSGNVTVEPFWLLEFRRNELEPAGTFFSTNDFATRGGSNVFLGFGALPDTGTLGAVPREKDRDAGNFNQFGLAVRVMAPSLNNTEFGLYFARYNSRSPVISGRTPTSPISSAFVQATASSLGQQQLAPALIAAGIPAANVAATLTTLLGAALTNVPAAALPANLQPFYPAAAAIASGAGRLGFLTAASTGRYFTEYPEGINMFGASFNTSLGSSGISWQGEISLKNDVPLQVDDTELLFATMSALNPAFGANNQIGNFLGQLEREIPGYRRHNAWTAQTTLTKVFGPTLGAQQLTVLAEMGGVWVNLPSKDVLRYDGPATFTSGNPLAMVNTGNGAYPATPLSAYADNFSAGYQVFGRLDYNNIVPNVNLQPSVGFTHDVRGNTPLPLGNYLRGRKSLNLALEFLYRNSWSLELRYVNFFGSRLYNLLGDRDYFATTVKYSF